MTKYVLAPDSFKGSMGCDEAADAMKRGILRADEAAEVVCLPVADGGEGTMDVIAAIVPGRYIEMQTCDPLGRDIMTHYYITEKGAAVIELAAASGITLLSADELNPFAASTLGTGMLIADAMARGVRDVILTLGGSATNDGGAGIARALGVRLLDAEDGEVEPNASGLRRLARIDAEAAVSGLSAVRFTIACDVKNRLCGKTGASAVFGPQKGAGKADVPVLDDILMRYGRMISKACDKDILSIDGTGAAGGAAVPLLAFAAAEIVSGIETVLSLIGFDEAAKDADYILTGEGRIDEQTAYGKAIAGVLARAKKLHKPVLAFAGILREGYEQLYEKGLTACYAIAPGPVPLDEAMRKGGVNMENTVYNVIRTLKAGKRAYAAD